MDGQLVWFVALLLYVYDSISLENREAVLRYSLGGVTALLTSPSLTIAGRQIFVPNPLRPDQCDLLLTSHSATTIKPLERYFIERGRSLYLVHQAVSVGALVILFGLTPFLASRMNLLHACLISIFTTYWVCSFHWIEMWQNRRLLGVDGKAIRVDVLHVLLCPPNAVNSARRIAALRHPRYGVLPTLRAFCRYDAVKYEEQFQPLRANA